MAWNNDTSSSTDDELDAKFANNESAGKKKGWGLGKTKIKGAPSFGKTTIGSGSRKSSGAPKGFGRKGSTTKGNALKNA